MGNAVHWYTFYVFLLFKCIYLCTYRSVNSFVTFVFFFSPEKYDYVGRLLRDGEEPTNYSDEEDDKDK